MSCGVGRRHGLDPMLLWLWCRPAAAALIQPLDLELPYAVGSALKKKKKGGGIRKRELGRPWQVLGLWHWVKARWFWGSALGAVLCLAQSSADEEEKGYLRFIG